MTTMQELADDLATAKHNVLWLIERPTGLVGFKGLRYWAGRVEDLRTEIKEQL